MSTAAPRRRLLRRPRVGAAHESGRGANPGGRRLGRLPHRLSPLPHWLTPTPRRLGALAVVVVLIVAGWLWFRSSSLVAVRQVEVSGLSGPNVAGIRSTLSAEARTMTTLDISTTKLLSSVSGYPHISGITVSTGFPHRVTIAVHEQNPVAQVRSDGRAVAVDGAGLLLPGVSVSGLPTLSGAADTGGSRVTAPGTRAVLDALAAAPYQLLSHLGSAHSTAAHGIVVSLVRGPQIYMGTTDQLGLKWQAALATLANPNSSGAAYIDVSAPRRPTAGT